MVEILYLSGLVTLALGFSLYLYYRLRQQRKPVPHRGFRCVHHVTASGEPISFLLAPRDTPEPEEPSRSQHDEWHVL